MMLFDRLLGTSFFMPAIVEMGEQLQLWRRQPDPVPAPVLVLRPSGGLHRRAAGLRHRLRPDQHPCAQEHLRLPHDGVGDRGIGALSFVVWAHHMYVSGMNPYFGFFFATTTLIIAVPTAIKVYNWVLTLWRGDIHLTHADAVRPRLHRHLRQWRADRPVPRQCGRRRAAFRHHVRRRAFPHGDGRGADPGHLRRDLSLVPEDHRADAGRERSGSSISGSPSSAPT